MNTTTESLHLRIGQSLTETAMQIPGVYPTCLMTAWGDQITSIHQIGEVYSAEELIKGVGELLSRDAGEEVSSLTLSLEVEGVDDRNIRVLQTIDKDDVTYSLSSPDHPQWVSVDGTVWGNSVVVDCLRAIAEMVQPLLKKAPE